MKMHSTTQLLRRWILPAGLAALAACSTLDTGDSAGGTQKTGEAPPAAPPQAAAAPAATATDKPAAKQAAAESPAGAGEKKAENARIYKGTGVLLKPPAAAARPAEPADVSLNFEAADIRDIAKTVLVDILRESYIVDPRVQGSISFRTTQPLPRSALLPTLETVLRMNGIVLVKENGVFKVMPSNAARGSLSPRLGGPLAGYSVQIVPLKFAGAREMAKILEPFAPDPTAIKADEVRNLLILAGTQNEIQHMLDTIDMFDVDWLSGMSVGLFTLQSTDVKSVDAELNKIIGDKNLNPLAGAVRIIPIERLNSFLIITPQPQYLEQAKAWIERLDRVGATSGGSRLFVYQVQNGKAEHLADLLNQTFGSARTQTARAPSSPALAPGLTPTEIKSTGGTTAMPAAGQAAATTPAAGTTLSIADDGGGAAATVRVVADKENNALLIYTNSAGYEKIEAALKKLDVAPRQVLIEVTIAEVTLTDELKYGIEWLFTNGPRRSGQLITNSTGSLAMQTPGFSYAITSSTTGAIKAVLNMLADNNKLNILSSPHIMVADNQTAKIQVGDSVPTSGPQSVTGTGVVINSVQYLDTGVILAVTPHINAGGLVNLDVNQEVSTAAITGTSTLNSPTISKRSAKTIVTVQSGETMVLGGLITENVSADSSGLPFLSSIPVVGGLFGTQHRKSTKTELIVLITPRVANNVGQTKLVSEEFRRKLKETEDLLDCGTSNALGYTTRGGLWCMQPGRFDGKTDKMLDK